MIRKRSKLNKYQISLIQDYKKVGMKAKEVFSISKRYIGLPEVKFCIYFGFQLLAYSDSLKEAQNLRKEMYNII
jgi:hypothetical protein